MPSLLGDEADSCPNER